MPTYKKTILLTGAGFSKNFGGFLSREMWSKIFNNPKLNTFLAIKDKLRENFDFESVYAEVIQGTNFSEEDKNMFQSVIIDAYNDMDKMLGQYLSNSNDPHQVNFHGVTEFLNLFNTSVSGESEVGLHFTLNQDLFLERRLKRRALGLELSQYRDYTNAIQSGKISASFSVTLPDEEFVENFKRDQLNHTGSPLYIKLHGSSGWFSTTGSNQMVLGNNKLVNIMKEPLLKWYFEIFDEAICRDNVKLFICGYGFRDSHINEIIVKAVSEHGLKIYVISPINPEKFKKHLIREPSTPSQVWEEDEVGRNIWDAVAGFFPYSLKDIFPFSDRDTDKKKDLFNAITS